MELCERIADRVAELVEPSTTHETSWVRAHAGPCPDPVELPVGVDLLPAYRWQVRCSVCGQVLEKDAGQRLVPRPAVVEHPSLIDQLERAVESSSAGASSSGYESRPAANIEALDSLGIMEREAAIWVRVILGRPVGVLGEVPASADLRDLLGLLAQRAPTLEWERIRALDFDVLRWWARARVVTTWDVAPIKPHVPCMNCDRRGGIQVRVDPLSAICLHCGAAWDSSTIGILGNHIQLMMADPIDQPVAEVTA